jgi:glutathione S-transferase
LSNESTPLNATPAPYRFHAFGVSYFSAKVRPAIRYKGLWCDERRAELPEIMKRTGLGFIPILISPEGETWQDSTDIYRKLEQRHPEPPLFPAGPVQRIAARLVELYNDEFGLIPAMHYRWGSERGEAISRARFSAMIGSEELGNRAADRMVKARFLVGANPDAGPAIEAHTHDLLAALSSHFEEHPYLLGDRQSFADCALMGLIDGHLFCDLPSRQLLHESAWRVVGWIERCLYPNEDQQGEWLADDALAPTFASLLDVMADDAVPILVDILAELERWADSRPADEREAPLAVGTCATSLRGLPIDRAVMPYTLYSVQQLLDDYRSLSDVERNHVDATLASSQWSRILAIEPRHRVAKDGFKLVFE